MSKRINQSDHDRMVKTVADHYLKNNQFIVNADISGYDKPKKIIWKGQSSGHIPDVEIYVEKDCKMIVEVETEDSINESHTTDQWKLFSVFAIENKAKFLIVVPKGFEGIAEKRKIELQIIGEIIGI